MRRTRRETYAQYAPKCCLSESDSLLFTNAFPFPCIYPQTVTSCCVQTFAICDMLRFDFCRASFQIRLFPQCTGAFSRIHFQSKQHGFIGPSNLNQRPTFLRTISSFKESKADMLDDSYTRKWKKLLEPSHFDGAVTFEEAFGRKVDAQIFLISLKAGGFGLNLTAASYIFLMDPWWNPAVERQAIDRAHRIGQENKLTVYRPIIKDSVEEKVLVLQQSKRELFRDLMAEDDDEYFSGKLNMDDFQHLLS